MPEDPDVIRLQQQMLHLEERVAAQDERANRFEDRFDKMTEKLFDKLDETAAAQHQTIESLREDLQPVIGWMNNTQGWIKGVMCVGAIMTTIIGAIWAGVKFFFGVHPHA